MKRRINNNQLPKPSMGETAETKLPRIEMIAGGPVSRPKVCPSSRWMPSARVALLAGVFNCPRVPTMLHCAKQPTSICTAGKPPSNCWTKSHRGNWAVRDGWEGKGPRFSEIDAGAEGRGRLMEMSWTHWDGISDTAKVSVAERSGGDGGEEEAVTHSEGKTGLDSLVEVLQKTSVSDNSPHVESSSPPDEGLTQGFSSDALSSSCDEESTGIEKEKICHPKRGFCDRCCKAATRCICGLIPTQVNNRTRIVILQNKLENYHHLGTARIAVLGLRNVELISVPEADVHISGRMRPKVPGSKRQITGRGGKKSQFLSAQANKSPKKHPGEPKRQTEATILVKQESERQSERADADNQVVKMATLGTKLIEQDVSSIPKPSWIDLQPDAGLLFPSEHAVDLRPVSLEFSTEDSDLPKNDTSAITSARRPPSQLIVLDGTWSKAKRIFYENPWLHSLPHYRLPYNDGDSLYGILRKEPKPGCLSTIESIVLALQTLEPETEGLDHLLHVFSSMMQDQIDSMGENYSKLQNKVKSGLSQKSRPKK